MTVRKAVVQSPALLANLGVNNNIFPSSANMNVIGFHQ